MLVQYAHVTPLVNVRSIGRAGAFDVCHLAAVDRRHPEVPVAHRDNGPFLVIAVQPIPEVNVRCIGGADAGDIHHLAAGDAGDLVLAVADVGKAPLLLVAAVMAPLDEFRAVVPPLKAAITLLL